MARTAPVPNIPAIPGMNPGVFLEVTDASGRVVHVLRGRDRRIVAFEAKNTVAQGRWVAPDL
ncbi:hypothetical protein WME91_26105 [Sorangium sp. So ce269]